jgi:spheroidene monooxygenase
MTQIVTISFYRFGSLRSRVWAFAMMGLARRQMSRIPGIGFWKLFGSGSNEGFTPKPNVSVYAVLATWPDRQTAERSLQQSPIFARYRQQSTENWTIFMKAEAARGRWSGQTPFSTTNQSQNGPLAVMTRATRVPNISQVIGQDPNVVFKIGIGEVPWLQQVTFSIWPSLEHMNNFARKGHHARAIQAVRMEGWFKEELYARFTLIADTGTWEGDSPLKKLDIS